MHTPPQSIIQEDVRRALAEDIGNGDITAGLIAPDTIAEASVITREHAIICGIPWFNEVFAQLDDTIDIRWLINEGDAVTPGQILCNIVGAARSLLTGERTALNFLQTLSGTATTAHSYSAEISGTSAVVLDTRKTIPGLRQAQKYAVRCGGCSNHRMGLYDAFLIKENHIMACGSIEAAVEQARSQHPNRLVEVEVENLDELQQALASGADIIMLDNMTPAQMKQAAIINNGQAKLEASGNISLENIRQIALTGVDYISTGSITKHLQAIDLSMRLEQQQTQK